MAFKIIVDETCPPGRVYFIPKNEDLQRFVDDDIIIVPTEGDKEKIKEMPDKIKEMFAVIKNVGGR